MPIIKDWQELKANVAVRLGKYILNEVAEFQSIINARVYIYKITEHSLYLAYTRGYSAGEIVRILKMLSKNVMPMEMEKLIRQHVNSNKYYRATMILRGGNYCVQSENKEVLAQVCHS